MKNVLLALCSIAFCTLAVSCTPNTPAARIAARPMAFGKLSGKHKELVQRGEIDKGMDMSAVALAWGQPSKQLDGFDGTRRIERWEYNASQPVMTNRMFNNFMFDPFGNWMTGAQMGPDIIYIPYRRATVLFSGGKVDEWERIR